MYGHPAAAACALWGHTSTRNKTNAEWKPNLHSDVLLFYETTECIRLHASLTLWKIEQEMFQNGRKKIMTESRVHAHLPLPTCCIRFLVDSALEIQTAVVMSTFLAEAHPFSIKWAGCTVGCLYPRQFGPGVR